MIIWNRDGVVVAVASWVSDATPGQWVLALVAAAAVTVGLELIYRFVNRDDDDGGGDE